MPDSCEGSLSDDDLLVAIQTGDLAARDLLASRFGARLRSVAQRRCRALDISLDHDEDIVQGVYVRVLDPRTTRFDPQCCTARQWLAGLAYNEAKAWRLMYRHRADNAAREGTEGEIVDPMDELVDDRWRGAFVDIVTNDLFRAVLKNETARISRVVSAHYLTGVELQSLARQEGISTFKMSRELRGFYARAALLRQVFTV